MTEDDFIRRIFLQFPPSVNKAWRTVGGRGVLSREARRWRTFALNDILLKHPKMAIIISPVTVKVVLNPPDRRRRDLDNFVKAIFDVLTKAWVWEDDSLVFRMVVEWGTVGDGTAEIEIFNYVPRRGPLDA